MQPALKQVRERGSGLQRSGKNKANIFLPQTIGSLVLVQERDKIV